MIKKLGIMIVLHCNGQTAALFTYNPYKLFMGVIGARWITAHRQLELIILCVHLRQQFRILAFIVPVHDAGYILLSDRYGAGIAIGCGPAPAVPASDV
jgi:hypothetical protein